MKKILAMLLALSMVLTCVAAFAEAVDPDSIEDNVTSADGTYELAFITDVGDLKDKSFNQGTWNGVKAYAVANGLTYKYYRPGNGNEATDTDRYDAMKAAADAGAKVIVCAGFLQGNALAQAAAEFTDIDFVFIDGWSMGMNNLAGVAYKEEQSGYLAGYAVVKEGYTKLGFCGGGGGQNPAVDRYGYGFAQGANAAAKELGITVDLKYSWAYGASFSASAELQTMADGWYSNGTEVIFACGGTMFNSIVSAANDNDCKVIGVDVDQSFESSTVITSALKKLTESTMWAIGHHYDGTFAQIASDNISLGANDDMVGLPVATWSLQNFTVEQYETMYAAIKSGEMVIDNTDMTGNSILQAGLTNLAIDYVE